MDELIGPFSEGNVLLRMSVLIGLLFAAVAWGFLDLVELAPSPSLQAVVLVGTFISGLMFVFLGHVVWHYRRARASP